MDEEGLTENAQVAPYPVELQVGRVEDAETRFTGEHEAGSQS